MWLWRYNYKQVGAAVILIILLLGSLAIWSAKFYLLEKLNGYIYICIFHTITLGFSSYQLLENISIFKLYRSYVSDLG